MSKQLSERLLRRDNEYAKLEDQLKEQVNRQNEVEEILLQREKTITGLYDELKKEKDQQGTCSFA